MRFRFCALLVLLAACGPQADAILREMAVKVEEATPPGDRPGVAAQMDALLLLNREGKLGAAEHRALVDLYSSAAKDGAIDEDERAVLVHLVRDVVAGGGSVHRISALPTQPPEETSR